MFDALFKLVPWYVRWGAKLLLIIAAMGFAAYHMHEWDDELFQSERDGWKQERLTAKLKQQTVVSQNLQNQVEVANAWNAVVLDRQHQLDAALGRVSALERGASGRFVSTVAGAQTTSGPFCYDPAKLDKAISEWVGRERRAALEGLGIGQGAVDDRSLWEDAQKRALKNQ